jgi:hypothetical protein
MNHQGINITSNATGQTSGFKIKAVNQVHRTLGFHLTGDGTSTAHKKIMKKKQKDIANQSSAAACNGAKVPWRTICITWQSYHTAQQLPPLPSKSVRKYSDQSLTQFSRKWE